jgi:hypothetical protein
MKKIILILNTLLMLCAITHVYSQVGINTTTPKATLDVEGKPSIISETDGILPPRLLRSQLISKTDYGTDQIGIIVYVSDLSGTNNAQTVNVTEIGHYYFNGSVWVKVGGSISSNAFGDIKSGIQANDHNGWVILDGRPINSLTVTQQTVAASLGLSGNLPDANNAYLSQNGSTLGNVSGTNNKNILQNQLPNVTLTGNTNIDGEHSHDLTVVYWRSNGNADIGAPGRGTDFDLNTTITHQTDSQGAHSHTVTTSSINGGVTQQSFDISPRTLSVNNFIYLGN